VDAGISYYAFKLDSWKAFQCEVGFEAVQGNQLRRRVFPSAVNRLREYIRHEMGDVAAVATTSDGWSRRDLSLVSLAVSFCNAELEIISLPVAARLVTEAHTAQVLNEQWERAVDSSFLPERDLLGTMATDSGAAYRRAAKDYICQESAWPCMCHLIELLLGSVNRTCDTEKLFERSQRFIAWVWGTPARRQAFDAVRAEIPDAPSAGLVMYVPTRFCTRIASTKSYIDNANAIASYCSKCCGGFLKILLELSWWCFCGAMTGVCCVLTTVTNHDFPDGMNLVTALASCVSCPTLPSLEVVLLHVGLHLWGEAAIPEAHPIVLSIDGGLRITQPFHIEPHLIVDDPVSVHRFHEVLVLLHGLCGQLLRSQGPCVEDVQAVYMHTLPLVGDDVLYDVDDLVIARHNLEWSPPCLRQLVFTRVQHENMVSDTVVGAALVASEVLCACFVENLPLNAPCFAI